MSTPSPNGSGARLGTQLRGKLAAGYKKRGKTKGDLVLHHSFKCRADVPLAAEMQLLHFLHAESDPDVESVVYEPSAEVTRLAGSANAKLVHAAVTLKDGTRVWRRLIQQLPDTVERVEELVAMVGKGALAEIARVETIDRDLLTANPVRLRNALRATSWIAAAKHWPLIDHKLQILKVVRARTSTFEEVINLGEGAQRALFGAAVLELAFAGSLGHDLFELPLTAVSVFHPTMKEA
ncbi:MAG: hypothetical protein ACT6S0_03220 [Roseateles sp.]|uniref:hypothetical protein n=1 Tax=Roseateles sp. TaxID=1971397 RepID=UPI00403627F9